MMSGFHKIGLLKEEICEMIVEREHDISKDSNPNSLLSLPQLRNDLEYTKNILASAQNSKRLMVELLKKKLEDVELVEKDALSKTRETIEKMKAEYAGKIIDEGHLMGQVRGLTREVNSLQYDNTRLREEIRDVKGEFRGSGDGNPWQVGVSYGGRRAARPRERRGDGLDWGHRGERRDRDKNRGRDRDSGGGYGYGKQPMW